MNLDIEFICFSYSLLTLLLCFHCFWVLIKAINLEWMVNQECWKFIAFQTFLISGNWICYCRKIAGWTQFGLVPFCKVSSLVLALIIKSFSKMRKICSASTVFSSFAYIVRLTASIGRFGSSDVAIKMSFALKK